MRPLSVFAIDLALASAVLAATEWIATADVARPVHEIRVAARQFAFEPATIQVTAGEPVRIVVRSNDTAHGFAIRELKIDLTIPRGGEAATAEFIAPPVGRYEIACSEFCGSGHARMKAELVSVAPVRTTR